LTRRDNQQIKTSLHTTTKPTIIPSSRRQTTIQIVARTSPRLSRYMLRFLVPDDGVEDGQQLSGDGDQRHHLGFPAIVSQGVV
jgi:hypothetical protein